MLLLDGDDALSLTGEVVHHSTPDTFGVEFRELSSQDQRAVGDLIGIYSFAHLSTVHIVYEAEPLGPASPGREALEIDLVPPERIPWDDLAFNSTHAALRDWIARLGVSVS